MVAAAVAATAATSAIGAGLQSSAAGNATSAQQAMYNQGSAFDQSVYGTAQSNLSPWISTGQEAEQALRYGLGIGGFGQSNYGGWAFGQGGNNGTGTGGNGQGFLTSTFNPTAAQLEQTPGYQFDLSQGLRATQNSNAAQGLGSSGPALAAAAQYATGLAQNTYGQQYQIYQDNLNQIYNRLMGVSTGGAQAATGLGNIGTGTAGNMMQGAVATGGNIGSNMIGAGNAQAAAVTGPANMASQYAMANNLINGMYGSSYGGAGQVDTGG